MTPDRPRITCLMTASLDGRLHPSRYTNTANGKSGDWDAAYEAAHAAEAADAWLIGRVTMAEMAKGTPHPPSDFAAPPRPIHVAGKDGPFGIAIDRSGKLHFAKPDIGGDAVIVLLGPDVADAHLAALVGDGISYIVATDAAMALPPLLATLRARFGIETLLLEGGAHVNGAFFAEALVDALIVILTPTLDGAPNPAIVEAGEAGLKGKVTLTLEDCERLDSGALRLRYAVAPDPGA